jgi:PAS domain S-box-containing protein
MQLSRQQHEEDLQRLEDEVLDARFTFDERGLIQSFNAAAEHLFGYKPAEILYRSVGSIIPTAASKTGGYGLNSMNLATPTPGGFGFQITGQRKNGTQVPLDLRLSEATERGQRIFHAIARDLTDRLDAERANREAQFLDGLLQSVGVPLLMVDKEGLILRFNPAFQQLVGFESNEIRHHRYWELLLQQTEWGTHKISLAQVIASGLLEKGEYEWRSQAGEPLRIGAVLSPLRAGNQRAEFAVLAAYEIPASNTGTEVLAAVERLAGGIAEQFNNLLTSINGYSELALHGLDARDPARADIEQIKKAGERAAALTSQLLAFSRRQPMNPSVFTLNNLITEMKPMLDMLLGDRIHISTVLDLELYPLRADANWIEQVILNLAVNARDAMPDGGKLTIETENISLDAMTARRKAQLAEGDYVALTVSDTGAGMDPQIRRHLFEPFQTTKSGKGLGLGLSTVYGVVRQTGGNVVVQSIPGSGTSIKIYLPRYAELTQSEKNAKLFLVRGAGA